MLPRELRRHAEPVLRVLLATRTDALVWIVPFSAEQQYAPGGEQGRGRALVKQLRFAVAVG
jgi:hypothetical protein